jgi:hypothetical protein
LAKISENHNLVSPKPRFIWNIKLNKWSILVIVIQTENLRTESNTTTNHVSTWYLYFANSLILDQTESAFRWEYADKPFLEAAPWLGFWAFEDIWVWLFFSWPWKLNTAYYYTYSTEADIHICNESSRYNIRKTSMNVARLLCLR